MKQTFQVENVKCQGCAKALESKLFDDFGKIEVNLDVFPREITLEYDKSQKETLSKTLKTLGYPLSQEKLNFVENQTFKAKSFISCTIGKMQC